MDSFTSIARVFLDSLRLASCSYCLKKFVPPNRKHKNFCKPSLSLNRPTQSIMYFPLQVNRFKKIILLIVQYKYSKSCSRRFYCPNLILRTRLCGTMFITQPSCLFDFQRICQPEMICIGGVPVLKRHFGGAGP